MKSRIQQVGDGLAVLIPPSITHRNGLEANAEVEVTLENGAMITRAAAQPRYTLDELVHRITSGNQHPETETGPVVGREVW